MRKKFSCDAETNGLYGFVFAIGVVVFQAGVEIDRFVGRIPFRSVTNEWVKENVLPALEDMPITHQTTGELEEAFWKFWMKHREDSLVIAHCGSPVESGLFRRCVERDLVLRQWSGPFPAIDDVATLLRRLGEDPGSVDTYIQKHNLEVPFDGTSHHPLYDAFAALVVWDHAWNRLGPVA